MNMLPKPKCTPQKKTDQSMAILRHVARKFDLYGGDEEERCFVDMVRLSWGVGWVNYKGKNRVQWVEGVGWANYKGKKRVQPMAFAVESTLPTGPQ